MSDNVADQAEKGKSNRDRQRRYRQKFKDAGLKEVRVWVPEDSEFLIHVLAAQLRDKRFYDRPTDKQIEYAKDISSELNEAIPENAVCSKQAMARWIKGQKKRLYDKREEVDEDLKNELMALGMDISEAMEIATPKKEKGKPRKRVLKGTKRPWAIKSSS